MWGLHRNSILSGLLDYYCLSCDEHFKLRGDATEHLNDDNHTKNLKNHGFLSQFQDHGIRQFSAGYHCQFCNKLFQTLLQVKAHVNENNHIHNVLCKSIKRAENGADVVLNNAVIGEDSWNGIIEGSCVLCNKDVETGKHTMEKEHLINLIRSEIQIDGSGNVYRKLQHSELQCLICNVLLDLESAKTHFQQSDHKNSTTAAQRDSLHEMNDASINVKTNDTLAQTPQNSDKVTEDVSDKKEIIGDKIVEETSTITGEAANDDNTNKNDSNQEAYGHNMQLVKVSNDEHEPSNAENGTADDVQALRKKNFIVLMENKQATCIVCEKKLSSAIRCLNEHVSGAKHKANLEEYDQKREKEFQTREEAKYNKSPTIIFLDNPIVRFDDTIYLDEFALSALSFHIVTNTENSKRCLVCEKNLLSKEIETHCKSDQHIRRLQQVPVITNFGKDFFREIRPNVLHCGFCNCLIVDYRTLPSHQISSEHQKCKIGAYLKYYSHSREVSIVRHNMEERREFANMLAFFHLMLQ